MAKRLEIMVSGNKPRLKMTMEGDRLIVNCSKCFAEFLRRCARACRGHGDMPTMTDAAELCKGAYGYQQFPQEAYDLIVSHAAGNEIDIPLSLQAGVVPETPIPLSQADVETIARKTVEQAVAKVVEELIGQNALAAEPELDNGDNDNDIPELVDIVCGPTSPVIPTADASAAAVRLAKRRGIDLTTIEPNASGKIDVRCVKQAIKDQG